METEERPHTDGKDCWCNPTVEYVPPRKPLRATETDDTADA